MNTTKSISNKQRQAAIELLHSSGCSCIITDGERFTSFNQRGIKDLYEILMQRAELLDGAFIADKVVGKGAAALMALGGISAIYADVISTSALQLLQKYGIEVSYNTLTDHIINRSGTGMCPVENICQECVTANECLPLIKNFIEYLPQ